MELLNQLKRLWRALRGTPNSWPAIDLSLPGGRHLHLVGSIHMGTRDMAPLPAKLVKKLRQPTRWSLKRIFLVTKRHSAISQMPAVGRTSKRRAAKRTGKTGQ